MNNPAPDLLDRLEAEERIRWTLAWLPQLFDAREEIGTLVDAFTPDAEVTWDSPAHRLRGHEALASQISNRWQNWSATASFVTNLQLTWLDEVVRVTSYHQCWIWHSAAAGESRAAIPRPADRVRAWSVEDLMQPTPGGWAIKRRHFRILGPGGIALLRCAELPGS